MQILTFCWFAKFIRFGQWGLSFRTMLEQWRTLKIHHFLCTCTSNFIFSSDTISFSFFLFFRPELEQKNHLFTQIVIQSTGDRICFIKTRTTTTGNSPCIKFTNRRSSINRLEGKMIYKEGHMHRFLRRWVSLRFASGHLFLWVAFTSELSPLRARFNP